MVDAEWQLLFFEEFQTWLVNSAIAEDLLAQLAALEAEKDDGEKDKRISYQNARGEPAVELFLRKGIWLKMRRVVFAAVSGDADAIALVEQHLGVGKVAMGPHTVRHLESVIPMHVFADRAISTRIAWRNAAHRELQRLRRERLERTERRGSSSLVGTRLRTAALEASVSRRRSTS